MVSAMPSASVLPSSRASWRPISWRRAMISSEAAFRMSWRCWMPERDQPWKAALAAAIALSASALVARAKCPTTSSVLDGLTFGMASPSVHSPAM